MEETNFVLLWKEHYEKIDQSLAINKRLLKELLTGKADSSVRWLIGENVIGIVAAIVWLGVLGALLSFAIAHYNSAANYFIASMGGIFLINVKAISDYIRFLILLNGIRNDGSISEIQNKLRRLQLSMIRHTRIMVLQFPLWTTFYLSDKWFPGQTGPGFIMLQVATTAAFTWLAIWLYKKLSLINPDNRLARIFISGVGGKHVLNALKFYRELEELDPNPKEN
jgi:hypothetical protein